MRVSKLFGASIAVAAAVAVLSLASVSPVDASCPWQCTDLDFTNCEECTKCSCNWCPGTKKCHSKATSWASYCREDMISSEGSCAKPPPIDGPPVIAVPGVAGSMLKVTDTQTRTHEILWARATHLTEALRDMALGRYNPETKTYEAFNHERFQIGPDRSAEGLYALDNLNPNLPVPAARYWYDMFNFLADSGYNAGKNMYGFPYDWRQSNMWEGHMTVLKELVVKAYDQSGGKRVAFITHSMGCLVVRSLLAKYPDFAEKYVSKFISLGCPWEGAPGRTTQGMVGGYDFGMPSLMLTKEFAHLMDVGVPSMYELMPNPKVTWSPAPWINYYRKNQGRKSVAVNKFNEFFAAVNEETYATVQGVPHMLPFDTTLWNDTMVVRDMWDNYKLPPTIQLYNVIGTSLPTDHSNTYDKEITSWKYLRDEQPHGYKNDFVEGDGTVPLQSARHPANLPPTQEVSYKCEHFELIKHSKTFDYVTKFLGEKPVEKTDLVQLEDGTWVAPKSAVDVHPHDDHLRSPKDPNTPLAEEAWEYVVAGEKQFAKRIENKFDEIDFGLRQ